MTALDPFLHMALPAERSRPRTAVISAAFGARGVDMTLRTLRSLEEAWRTLPCAWDVVVTGSQHDPALAVLREVLSGDVEVATGAEVERAIQRADASGRRLVRINAGDAVPVERDGGPMVVPLVDHAFPSRNSWNNYYPDHDGAGTLVWERTLDPLLSYPLMVFTHWSHTRGDLYRARRKVLWMCEPAEIYREFTDFVLSNPHLFDLVISNDRSVVEQLPRAALVPIGGCWIPPQDQVLGDKSQWCSLVTSGKGWLSGHRARLACAEICSAVEGVHLFGKAWEGRPGHQPLPVKSTALLPYMYSVVVENVRSEDYFTEKIIDCFRCGTIPIYWGARNIGDYFDLEGVLTFDHPEELPELLASATEARYWNSAAAVVENYSRAADYRVTEDRIAPLLEPLLG